MIHYAVQQGSSDAMHGTTAYNALYALTCTMLSILLLREVVQMIQCGYKYILDMENWIECAIFAIAVTYLTKLRANADIFDETVTRWAAVAVLLAWFEVTLLLGRIQGIGIYVYNSTWCWCYTSR